MPPRKAAQMTAGERAAKVDALKPEWAKTYIRQLEGLTRALAAQLQAAQGRLTDANLTAQAATAGVTEIADQGHSSPAVLALDPRGPDQAPAPQASPSAWVPPGQPGNPESAAWLAGITPPSGEYATVRVVDGRANMDPVADLDDRAEIRFADFYQVHYGAHETTGGMRVLIVETGDALVLRPVSPTAVIISRGGTSQ